MTSEEEPKDETPKLHACGWPEDSFACKIRHLQINTGDANSKRSRWDRAAELHQNKFNRPV